MPINDPSKRLLKASINIVHLEESNLHHFLQQKQESLKVSVGVGAVCYQKSRKIIKMCPLAVLSCPTPAEVRKTSRSVFKGTIFT